MDQKFQQQQQYSSCVLSKRTIQETADRLPVFPSPQKEEAKFSPAEQPLQLQPLINSLENSKRINKTSTDVNNRQSKQRDLRNEEKISSVQNNPSIALNEKRGINKIHSDDSSDYTPNHENLINPNLPPQGSSERQSPIFLQSLTLPKLPNLTKLPKVDLPPFYTEYSVQKPLFRQSALLSPTRIEHPAFRRLHSRTELERRRSEAETAIEQLIKENSKLRQLLTASQSNSVEKR